MFAIARPIAPAPCMPSNRRKWHETMMIIAAHLAVSNATYLSFFLFITDIHIFLHDPSHPYFLRKIYVYWQRL